MHSKIVIEAEMGNALPIVFWGSRGYADCQWGYGCQTFEQFNYERLVIKGERFSWNKP